jgi:undecaprenyl-diphosphatase
LNRLRQLVVAFLVSGFAAALAALALFSWLAEEVMKGGVRTFDAAARDFVQRIASTRLTEAMRGFTFLGEWLSIFDLTILAILLFYREGRKRAALLMAITTAGGALLETMLKQMFHRVRPAPFFDTPLPSSYSFPSGHAVLACCFFGSLAAMITAREPKRAVRIAVWTAAALLAALIGFSRVYLGVHYASDVIAGYAAAVVWVFTVGSVYKISRGRAVRSG